jgi:glucokinase
MSCAIGIDLGGTYIKYGLVDQVGTIVYESIRPTYLPGEGPGDRSPGDGSSGDGSPGDKPGVYDNIINALIELRELAFAKDLLPEGIGIGVPGIVDAGLVTGCAANLPELEGMALGSRVEKQLGMPVWVENDANLMGLAEWKFGAARNLTDVIFLTIGTGIGGAMVVNGELYAGYRDRGAELGHIIVALNGLPCGCGGRGCLEAHASVKALIEDYKGCLTEYQKAEENKAGKDKKGRDETEDDKTDTEITGSLIISRYLDNQPAAVTALNRHFDYLGAGIAGLINIFSPQKLIIGGGISEAGDFYIDAIRQRAMERAMKETSLYTSIEGAQLGNKAGFMGAAALVFNSV